jgi:hypothetical protein
MTPQQQKSWEFLDDHHEARSFELGQCPEEFETPYSLGADAIKRIAAIDAKANDKGE